MPTLQELRRDAAALHRQRMMHQESALRKGIMPMNQERSILHYLKNVYDRDVIITKSYLSNAVQMADAATQNINFNFQQTNQKAGTSSNSPIDNLLNMVDTFEVTGFRLALFTLPSTAAGSNQVAGNYGNATKHYYPNPNVFSGTTGGVESDNLNNIYNGVLFIKIDSTVFFESMQVADLMKVGTTEQGTAVSSIGGTGVIKRTSGDVRHIENDCTPMFMLNGSGKNDIQINLFEGARLGSLDAAVGATTRINFVELQLLGFLCQGGAKQGVKKA